MKKKSLLKTLSLLLSLVMMFALIAGCSKDDDKKDDKKEEKAEEKVEEKADDKKEEKAEEKEEKAEEPAKETEAAPDVSDEGFVIGFAQAQADSPYYVTLQDSAEAACEEAGVDFRLIDAAKDPSKQSQDVADLIQAGVDLVILNPVDSDSCAPAIQSSLDSGVPLITVNRPSNAEGSVSHVGEDNKLMGKTVGLAALDLLGGSGNVEGKVIIEFMGGAGNNNTNLRSAGFHEAFEGEGVEIVQSPYCDFNRAKAVEAAQDLFQANPDVELVFAHNDDMAIGAMQVAEQQGLEGIFFTGVDGLMEAVEYIVEGKYHVTTMNDPKLQGQESVKVALKILAGEEVDDFVDVGTQLITADNAADYVSDEDFATQVKD